MTANEDLRPQWFERIGMPLDAAEHEAIAAILVWHGFPQGMEIVAIGSWGEALALLDAEARESRLWDAQEGERERLWELGTDRHTEDDLVTALATAEAAARQALVASAAQAAARLAMHDRRFVAEASGAAQIALHHSTLADLARADERHPFHATLALFAGGRWPLGHAGGRFFIF